MVQSFHVVRCYNCDTFQVDIVKKSTNKWQCKICQRKQSLQQIYGEGTGKECRLHVQKLNQLRAHRSATINEEEPEAPQEDHIADIVTINNEESKWKQYIQNAETNEDINKINDEDKEGVNYVLEIPIKKRKGNYQKKEKYASDKRKPGATENVESNSGNEQSIDKVYTNCNIDNESPFQYNNMDIPSTSSDCISNVKNSFSNSKKEFHIVSEDRNTNCKIESRCKLIGDKPKVSVRNNSKWSQYLEPKDDTDLANDSDQTDYLNSSNVHEITSDKFFQDPSTEVTYESVCDERKNDLVDKKNMRGCGIFQSCDDSNFDEIFDI